MEITYRRLEESDLDTFISMRITQLREEGATEDIDLIPALKDYYHRHLADGTFVSWLALDGEKIIGTILAGHDGRRGFFHHVVVAPEYRNRGIGEDLVNHAMDALEKEGIQKTALVVFEYNDLGNGFWEHIGFTTRPDLVYRNKYVK